jgi:hypothetical protein
MDAVNVTGGTLTMLFAVGPRGSGAGRPDPSAGMQADLMRLGASGALRSGDGVLGFFVRASEAVMAALHVVRGSEVAVALASGDPGRGSGLDHRCISLSALAGPGQVLVSASTAGLVSRLLPPGAVLVDLGRHRVSGDAEPERVYHMSHPDLSSGPSALAPGHVSAMPSPWTTFVGRHRELEELPDLAAGPGLVTLTGLGGCGKTRLAIEVAAGRGGDGAAFADLRAVNGREALLRAVADALGLPSGFATGTARPLAEEITAALAGSDTMLVLDACEEVLEESAALAHSLLSSCPGLTILATSREPLGVTGETVFAVGPLGTGPGAGEAVELFVDRARAAAPDLTMDAEARSAAEEVCRRLDGIPLAIELAAARAARRCPSGRSPTGWTTGSRCWTAWAARAPCSRRWTGATDS